MKATRSIGRHETDTVAWCRAGLCSNIILSVFVAVAFMASGVHLSAQSKTGTASLAVQVAPAVQLTTNGSTNVSLWIRLGTSNGYLWGDGTNSCNSPIGTATTYTASGAYNNIPLSGVPFGSSNTYVCAFDPGAAIASVYLLWPHTDASLKFSTQPTNTASGASISPAVTVQVLDSNGLVDTTSSATVNMAIGTNAGGGTLSGTTSVAAVAGVATFSNLSINNAGTGYTLTASITTPSLSATSSTFNITGGALDHFKVEKTGGGAIGTQVAGTAFGLRITAQDVNNNTVTSFTSTASLTSTGTLTGSPVTGNFVAGVLDPQSVTITNTGSFTITASASGKTGTSAAFTVNSGPPAKLVFTTQPGGGTGGTIWSTQPVVTLQDANGNTVTGTAQSVTLTIQNNAGPGGVLSGTTTAAVNTSTGQATFSGLSINTKGTGYTLTATGGSLTAATSNPFNITVGAAAKLVFTTEPVGGIYASPFPTQPVVTVEDAGGNTVTTSSASVTLAITSGTPASGGPGTLACTGGLSKSASSGVATFSGCTTGTTNGQGVGYSLTATSGTLTQAISSLFNVTSGPAGLSAPTVGAQTPTPVPAGSSATYLVTVNISPASACTATLSITGFSTGASGSFGTNPLVFTNQSSLSTTLTVTTLSTTPVGAAAAPQVWADGSNGCSGNYETGVSFVVSAGPGNASNSTVSAGLTSVPADGSTPSTITVTLKDANNNLVSGKTVTLAAGSGSSTITTVSGTTNASGQASFTVKDSTAETVIYSATDTTDSVTITQKATVTFTASKLAITSVNGGANPTAGTAFSVVVQAQDANGNPANVAANTGVTLSRNAGTGTLGGSLTGTIAAGTNSVTISGVTYTKAESGVVLNATRSTGDSLTAGNSAPFTVNPGAVNSFAISSISGTKTAGTAFTIATITAQDANSNTVTSFISTVTFGGTAGVTGTSAAFTAGVLSNASVTPTSAGSNRTVTVNDGSGHTGSATIATVSPGTATQLVFTTQPIGGNAGTAWTTQPIVTVEDAYGNSASSSASITLAIGTNPGGGALTCTTNPKSATSGVATFAGCYITLGGTGYTLTAASTGFTTIISSAFNVADFTLSESASSASVTRPNTLTETNLLSLTNLLGGFSGTVALTCNDPTSPQNFTCNGTTGSGHISFSPASISGSGTSTMTAQSASSTTRSAHTITITGTPSNGGLARTVQFIITVN